MKIAVVEVDLTNLITHISHIYTPTACSSQLGMKAW